MTKFCPWRCFAGDDRRGVDEFIAVDRNDAEEWLADMSEGNDFTLPSAKAARIASAGRIPSDANGLLTSKGKSSGFDQGTERSVPASTNRMVLLVPS